MFSVGLSMYLNSSHLKEMVGLNEMLYVSRHTNQEQGYVWLK